MIRFSSLYLESRDNQVQHYNLFFGVVLVTLLQLSMNSVALAEECATEAGVWLNKAILFFDQSRYSDALRACDRAIEIDKGCSGAWNTRGNSLSMLGRYEEAQQSLDLAMQHDPKKAASIWSNKGAAFERSGDIAKAIEAFHNSIELGFDAWANLAVSYSIAGDMNAATRTAEDAVKAGISRPASAFIRVGNALRDKKQFAEALVMYDRGIVTDPADADAWTNKGNALVDLERYEEALKAHDKALELTPRNPRVWINRGFVLYRLNRLEEALNDFNKTIALASGTDLQALILAWNNKGRVLQMLSQNDEALAAFQKAETLQAKDQSPKPAVDWIWVLNVRGDPVLSAEMKITGNVVGGENDVQIGVKANEKINILTKYLSIEILSEQQPMSDSVLIDGRRYNSIPYEIRLVDKFGKDKLDAGETATINIPLVLQRAGLFTVRVSLDGSAQYETIYIVEPNLSRRIAQEGSSVVVQYFQIIIAFLSGIIVPIAVEFIKNRYSGRKKKSL